MVCRRHGASAHDTAALLARVPVFEELGAGRPRAASPRSPCRARFAAGEVVFREGDDSDTCYVVRSGHARALREHADGRQITLATFGPGDIFGELAMFDDERRSATVEAIDDARGDRHPRRRHAPADARSTRTSRSSSSIALGRRLRAANERLARQSFQTVQSRVAAVLAQLVEQARAEGARRPRRPRSPPRRPTWPARRLLARVGHRFLAVLERAGVITQGRGRLTVHDPDALQGYVY